MIGEFGPIIRDYRQVLGDHGDFASPLQSRHLDRRLAPFGRKPAYVRR